MSAALLMSHGSPRTSVAKSSPALTTVDAVGEVTVNALAELLIQMHKIAVQNTARQIVRGHCKIVIGSDVITKNGHCAILRVTELTPGPREQTTMKNGSGADRRRALEEFPSR